MDCYREMANSMKRNDKEILIIILVLRYKENWYLHIMRPFERWLRYRTGLITVRARTEIEGHVSTNVAKIKAFTLQHSLGEGICSKQIHFLFWTLHVSNSSFPP